MGGASSSRAMGMAGGGVDRAERDASGLISMRSGMIRLASTEGWIDASAGCGCRLPSAAGAPDRGQHDLRFPKTFCARKDTILDGAGGWLENDHGAAAGQQSFHGLLVDGLNHSEMKHRYPSEHPHGGQDVQQRGVHGPDGDEADGRGIAGTGKGRDGCSTRDADPSEAAPPASVHRGPRPPCRRPTSSGSSSERFGRSRMVAPGIEGGRVDQSDRRRVFSPAEAQAVFHAVAEMFDARGGDDRNARSKQEGSGEIDPVQRATVLHDAPDCSLGYVLEDPTTANRGDGGCRSRAGQQRLRMLPASGGPCGTLVGPGGVGADQHLQAIHAQYIADARRLNQLDQCSRRVALGHGEDADARAAPARPSRSPRMRSTWRDRGDGPADDRRGRIRRASCGCSQQPVDRFRDAVCPVVTGDDIGRGPHVVVGILHCDPQSGGRQHADVVEPVTDRDHPGRIVPWSLRYSRIMCTCRRRGRTVQYGTSEPVAG